MKILSLYTLNLILLTAIAVASGKPKNLQVLDFESIRDVKKYMNTVAKDLGVKCSFCHDIRNKSKDTNHKIIARDMMKMQREINERPEISVTVCFTQSTHDRASHVPLKYLETLITRYNKMMSGL